MGRVKSFPSRQLPRYEAAKDSVLQVTREDYLSCNTSSPIAAHKDGTTVVSFHRSGANYFVSGAEGACEKGQKMTVVVMSERHARRLLSLAPAPVEEVGGPAVPPSSGSNKMVVVKKRSFGCSGCDADDGIGFLRSDFVIFV